MTAPPPIETGDAGTPSAVRPAPADPLLDAVLDLQRTMSTVRTDLELIEAIGPRLAEITGGTHVMGLDVRGLAPGRARVRTVVVMAPDAVRIERHDWAEPPRMDPVDLTPTVAALVAGPQPRVIDHLDAPSDPVLAPWIDGPRDCLAVPVYVAGEIAEWMLIFRPAGTGFSTTDVRFASSDFNLIARTAIQLKLTEEIRTLHAELQEHLDGISALQRSLLPPSLPSAPEVEMTARYRPCIFAGGDTYDARWFGPRSLGVMVADVAGHGPPAAVVMGMMRTALAAHATLLPLRERIPIVTEMNRIMYESLRGSMFITGIFLKLDLDTGLVGFANAGHPPPRLLRARTGAVEEVAPATTIPLGIVPDLPDDNGTFQLEPGDVLAVYTDGFTEAFDPDRRAFGFEGLDAALAATPTGATPDAVADRIMAAVDRHVGGDRHDDDQCLMVLRFAGGAVTH